MKHWSVALLVLLLSPIVAEAQTVNDSGAWFAFFGRGDIGAPSDGLKWWFDGHLRFFDDTDGFGQSIVRPGVGYQIHDSVTAWAGYGWIRTSPATVSDVDEHRFWQQLTWSEKCDVGTMGLRSRLEQRLVETGNDTGHRFRQLVSYRKPLTCDGTCTFVVWDELFVHLNTTDWGAETGFNQNRAFVGFGFRECADSPKRVEVGYLNQHINRRNAGDLANHLLSVNIFYTP